LQKIYNDGNWERFIELFSLSGVELSNMEEAIKIFTDSENVVLQDDINVRNATRVITNKMLNEQGITPTSIKGYSAYSDYIAE
jgi:hypothetical protein